METLGFFSMAGSAGLAACTAEILTLPIDTAKVRMQVMNSSLSEVSQSKGRVFKMGLSNSTKLGFIPVMCQMVRDEGITAWWKGLPAGLHRQFIYASLRISMYPHIRDFLRTQKSLSWTPELGIQILAGMCSGAIGMTIANPTDVVKVRLQSAITASKLKYSESTQRVLSQTNPNHTVYRGAMHAYSTIIKEEGVLGLWRGLGPNIVRNAIVCAAEVVAYDELKKFGMKWLPDGLSCHCFAGFGAGFIATVIGSPVDVVKTRYMNSRPGEYKNITDCFIRLMKEAGPKGFYKGFVPNVVRLGSFNMIVFVLYEQILNRTGASSAKKNKQ